YARSRCLGHCGTRSPVGGTTGISSPATVIVPITLTTREREDRPTRSAFRESDGGETIAATARSTHRELPVSVLEPIQKEEEVRGRSRALSRSRRSRYIGRLRRNGRGHL